MSDTGRGRNKDGQDGQDSPPHPENPVHPCQKAAAPAERVEELTISVLDGEATDAEVEELERLVATDERTADVHVALVEIEATLRAEREGPDLAEAVLARIRDEIARRVEEGVMNRLRGTCPAAGKGGAKVAIVPHRPSMHRLGNRGFWLVSAGAAAVVAVAIGLHVARVGPGPAGPRPGAPTKLAPLELELPKPAFVGTPKVIPLGTTVEKPTGKPRPPFMVPAGLTNVAIKKPVSASDEEPIIGEIDFVTDGDKEARDGSYVELGPGTQYVQVDLGAEREVFAVVFWNYHGDPRVHHDVVLQAADDPDFIMGVRTIFNNDHDNSSGLGTGDDREYFELFEGRLVDTKGVKTRYVRWYVNGSTADDMNRFTEIEVYGRPASGR